MTPTNGDYRFIAEVQDLWTVPAALGNAVEYDLESYRHLNPPWAFIKNVSKKAKSKDVPPKRSVIENLQPLLANSFMKYEPYFICYDDGEDHIFFQRMSKATVRKNGRAVFIADGKPVVSDPSDTWFLNEEVDTIYDRKTDTVYFRKVWGLSRYFPGLIDKNEEYEHWAKKFFSSGLVSGEDLRYIGRKNLVRMEKVNMILEELTSDQLKSMVEYILKVDRTLYRIDGKIIVNNNEELTNILDAIEQKVYKAPVTGELRVATSTLPKKK